MSLATGVDPDVVYPATTPEMAESGLHSRVRLQAFIALGDFFAGRRDCFVCSDRNLYYRPRPDPRFVAPDLFVSFGVDPGPLEPAASYRLWESGAPAFVLEIASARTSDRDLLEKPGIYLETGAGEYWRLDPTGGDLYTPMLQADRLAGGAWEPIPTTPEGSGLRAHSEALGLELHAEAGRLRFKDPRTGLWLPDHEETRQRCDDAETARRAAEDRADAAETARRAAEDRADDAETARGAEAAARRAAEAELAALRARLGDR